MRYATVLLLAACLSLVGCSSGGASAPAPTVTVTETPTLSAAQAEQACVDAWHAVMTADGYDPDAEPPTPSSCEGLPGQADMYMEALQRRNAENRARVDECLDDPSCTSIPIP
ncbi:hypothetical protein [Streptomyces sp. Amel2xC10]|uniref:hypothetical protein n=1 Tax=Streptomyces sp. Amel2xC10 TaxID=1305826 RepID=UPI000A0827CB|nr:hypothetical protein [Streptomyces sp. Amel2xC10]SMF64585.1 hypothetical protein SAMN02745830_05018 [Streptomyces sp. Amel2xC10]